MMHCNICKNRFISTTTWAEYLAIKQTFESIMLTLLDGLSINHDYDELIWKIAIAFETFLLKPRTIPSSYQIENRFVYICVQCVNNVTNHYTQLSP
jgi:hypothetical protein